MRSYDSINYASSGQSVHFAQTQVEYLSHIISKARVGIDPKKIEAIVSWPKPANIQALRGFLGLTGYYWKFVKNYGTISKL